MNIELAKKSTDLVVRATGLRVVDEGSHALATDLLRVGKDMVKQIKDFFTPLKQDAHASWKGLCDKESEELAKLMPTINGLDRAVVNYRVEQGRIRREAEEKARQQEEERRRLEERTMREAEEATRRAEAEKRRIAEEAIAKELRAKTAGAIAKLREESALRQVEADRKAKEEQDRILNAAAAEEKKLAPVAVVPERIVNNGTAIRHNWKFRVTDLAAVPQEYLIVNEVLVGKIVRSSEGKIKIPGIEIYDDPSTMKTR